MLSVSFEQCLVSLPCYLLNFSLKRDSLDIYLTTFFGVRNFKNTSAIRVIFFWKCSKLNRNLQNVKKNWQNIFCFWDNCIWNIWKSSYKISIKRRILVIGSQWVNKKPLDFLSQPERLFQHEVPLQREINVVKMASCSFEQCLGTFTLLLVEGTSETGLFRHLSKHVSRSLYIQKYISYFGHVLL